MLVPDQANQATMTDYLRKNPWGFQTKEDVYLNDADKSLITNVRYNTYGLKEGAFEGERLKKSGSQTLIEADVEKVGVEIAKKWAAKYSDEYAKKMPGAPAKANFDSEFIGRSFLASEGAVSAISTLGGGIFESSIRAALDTQVGQRIEKAKKEDANNRLDFPVNPFIKQLFGIEGGEQFVDAKISGNPGSTGRKLADQIVAAGLYKPVKTVKTAAAEGYIPNFADNEPLKEAISREIAEGVAPARVRVTQDGRLKNRDNPNGLAVINTRDEPNGKIPNDFRERGMRAAMASRGFVPNFAEENVGVNVRGIFSGKTKKFDTKIDDLAKATNEALLEYKQNKISLEQLNEAINASKIKLTELVKAQELTADVETKYAQTVNEGIKKIDEKKKVKDGQQNTTATTGGGATGGGNNPPANDKKGLDIGKFLVFQSAVVGATSALQSMQEEGSNAALATEGFSAILSGAGTAVSLLGSGLGPVGIGLAAVSTAAIAAAPLFAKLYEMQKTPADRATEALIKLAKEAEKTGKKISPEEFLAALEQDVRKTQEKNIKTRASDTIKEQLKASKIGTGIFGGIEEEQIAPIFSALSAAGKINEQGIVEPEALSDILKAAIKTLEVKDEAGNVISKTNYISRPELIQAGKDLVVQNRAANLQNVEQRQKDPKVLASENEILNIGIKIRKDIFAEELRISSLQSVREFNFEAQNDALERQKGILTETAFAEQQRSLAIQKANDERQKAVEVSSLDLRKSLQGVKENSLGNVLSGLSQDQVENLSKAFAEGGYGGQAFQEAFKTETAKAGVKNGAGINFNELSEQSKTDIQGLFEAESKALQVANQTYANQVLNANQKLSLFQNETQKVNQRTSYLQEELSGSAIGAKKFSERLGLAEAQLEESTAQQLVNNKLEIQMGKKKFNAETESVKTQIEHEQAMRKLIPIEQRAEKYGLDLERTTNERIDQIIKESLASDKKYYSDLNLAKAEDEAYDNYLRLVTSTDEVILENEKQVTAGKKARRAAEVLAARQGKIFQEEIATIEDKIKVARAFNAQVSINDLSNKRAKELELAQLELIRSTRELTARQNNLAAEKDVNAGKTRIQSGNEILDIISTGNRGRTGFEGESRLSQVYESRLGGRKMGGDPTTGELPMSQAEIDNIKMGMTIGERMYIEAGKLKDEAKTFQEIIGDQTPKLFADGMAEAMQVALNQADNLGEALRNVAMSFLKNLQGQFLQSASRQIVSSIIPTPAGAANGGYVKGYASGGLVTGGSGYKDDVPAMLSEGEYVIRKSSVEKYGAHNLSKLNSGKPPKFAAGGIFLPGVRGQTEISGYKDLTAFAKQTTTSGATDVLAGGATTAFASLEDQSSRLSAYALMREDDTINQEIRSAQEQAMNIIAEREAYRTAERKAFQKQLIGTVASAALSYGVGQISNLASIKSNVIEGSGGINRVNALEGLQGAGMGLARGESIYTPVKPTMTPYIVKANKIPLGKAYGGMIPRFADGGSPTDKVPALVMGGEYIMSDKATKKYGKKFFDSINQGRAPRFADGGQVSTAEPSFAEKAASSSDSKATGATNVSININVTGGTSDTQTQGDTKQGGVDYKKMSEQIKQVVIQTINEEKRLGGSLRPRG